MMNNLSNFFLRYFFIGNIQFAPGTVSSFIIAILWFFIPNVFLIQALILVSHIILGFYFCYIFTLESEHKDPGYIVIDEVCGMMIALFLLPKIIEAYIISFILFRLLDILKPSIINRSQNCNFGVGIMLDDIVAGFIAFLITTGLYI